MRRMLLLIALGAGAAVAPAFAADELMQTAREHFQPIPQEPLQLPGNPATPDKVELGKMLFFEPRLSESWVLSCNGCHNLATGGADLQETSIGHGWHKGPRNAPTVLNGAFNIAQFWDGRAKDLEDQATGPMPGVRRPRRPAS
jgi:cytochrome c peroxidase